MRRGDRLIGIVLGIVLGLAIVAVFVFVFSEDTVDAPSIDEGDADGAARRGALGARLAPPRIAPTRSALNGCVPLTRLTPPNELWARM